MAYTWKQFTDAVKVFLTVDKGRIGIAEAGGYIDMMIRQGVLEIQSAVPFYRQGQQNSYAASDFTPVQGASRLDLPDGCEPLDCYVLRVRDPVVGAPTAAFPNGTVPYLTGTTSASATVNIVGSGSKFLSELRIGDMIRLTPASVAPSGPYVLVTAIQSDTSLTVLTAVGDGTSLQTIQQQVRFRYPVLPRGWDKREEYFTGQTCFNDNQAYALISPQGVLYLVPPIQAADNLGATMSFELNWDGVKLNFTDGDTVPFDEPVTLCVADYVKGQIARTVQGDMILWASYMGPIPPSGIGGGTFSQQVKKLYLDSKSRTTLKS